MKPSRKHLIAHASEVITLFVCGIVFSLIIFSSQMLAQDVRATARVDSNNILIGDWLKLHVELEYPTGAVLHFPAVPDSLQGLEIVRRDSPLVQRNDQRVLESITYTITAFDSGTFVVPPLVIQYTLAGDTTKRNVTTSPIPVFVHGISVDTTKEIKDVKPPLSVPITLADLLPYIIGILVAGGLVWLFLYIKKKRKKGESILPSAPARPAHEVALEALRSLDAEHLWQRGKVKEYHSQLTEILRTYIEKRFAVMALEMTSDEILSSPSVETLPKELREKLKEILLRADFVKFAKYQPSPQEHEESHRLAVAFVEETIIHQRIVESSSVNLPIAEEVKS
jgi:hypothetical protein